MPAVTPAPQRAGEANPSAGDDPYRLIAQACAQLATDPHDQYFCLTAIREYVRLGLAALALEHLSSLPAAGISAQQIESMRRAIETLPDAQLPFEALAENFKRNLAALHDRKLVAQITAAWSMRSRDYRLYQDINGNHQVRARFGGTWSWVPYLADHVRLDAQRPLPDDIQARMPGPYVFDGIGHGAYFKRVYDATLRTFMSYSCALYVVEPETANLAAILHLHDWSQLLGDPRIHWCVGADCYQRIRLLFREAIDLPFPGQALNLRSGSASPDDPCVQAVNACIEERGLRIKESFAGLERHYADRDVSYWAKRFRAALDGSGPPLRIVSAVSRHTTFLQYSLRDIRRALESLGHQCTVLTETSDYTCISPLRYHQTILQADADLFFNIDHLRPEFCGFIPGNLPILTWDQDQLPHVVTRENLAQLAAHDFVVGCSKSRCVALGGDARQFLSAIIPTSPEYFDVADLSSQERKKYACDISYVSHGSQTPAQFHEEERRQFADPLWQRLLDRMYELLPAWLERRCIADHLVMTSLLRQCCHELGIGRLDGPLKERLTTWYLWRLGDRIFRHQALGWVAEWARKHGRTFHIYGNGWERHPVLSPFARGPAQNGSELACIYRASRINLQLMPAGFIHQRALDGLAAGGFFLNRAVPFDFRGPIERLLLERMEALGIKDANQLRESPDPQLRQSLLAYFRIPDMDQLILEEDPLDYVRFHAEVPSPDQCFPFFSEIQFDSAESFARRAEHFLAHPQDRQRITEAMRKVVIERFTYRASMQRFLEAMRDYLAWRAGDAPG